MSDCSTIKTEAGLWILLWLLQYFGDIMFGSLLSRFLHRSFHHYFSFQHFVKVMFPNRSSLVLFSIYLIHFEISAPYTVVVKAECSGANCEEWILSLWLISYICVCVLSHSIVSDSLWPHGLSPISPARLLCPWRFSSKNTAVGCHALLQGIFLTQGSNPGLPHCRWILHRLTCK